MTNPISVLYGGDPAHAASVAGPLERADGSLTVTTASGADAVRSRLEADPVDCVVVDRGAREKAALLDAVRAFDPEPPVVLHPTEPGGTDDAGYDVLAARIRNAVARRRAEAALAEQRAINDLVSDVADALVRAASNEELERTVCSLFADAYGAAWIGSVGADGTTVAPRASAGLEGAALDADAADGPVTRSVATGAVEVERAIDSSASDDARADRARRREHRSVAAVPLVDGETRHGVLAIYADRANAFDRNERETLADLGATIAHAMDAAEERAGRRTSEANSREIFDSVNDAIFVHDVETGLVVDANERAAEMVGLPRESLTGAPVTAFSAGVGPYTGDRALEWIRAAAADGPQAFEWLAEDGDGDRFWMEVNLKRTTVDGTERVLAVVRNETDRRDRAETLDALHEATRNLMAAERPPEIAAVAVETVERVLDLAFAVAFAHDEAAGELVPVAMTESVERGYDDPRDALRFDADFGIAGRAFATGEPEIHQDVAATEGLELQDDRVRSVAVLPLGSHGLLAVGSESAGALSELDVYFAELLAANAEAALDRADRERLLRDRESELVRERDRSAALFENIPDPAVSCTFVDGEPVVRAVNSAFEAVFGYDADTVAGDSLDDYLTPEGRETEAADLNRTLQDGENVHAEVRRETVDGVRDFLLHVVPFKVGERSVHGYAIYTDITERKRHEERLVRQNERLAEFASIVSHDLRNPLNIAEGYFSLGRETGEDAHFEKVERAHDRMGRLIEELLELARQGKVVGEKEPVALADVAASAWEHVETANATLEIDAPGTVRADPPRLCELFENFFRNAVEHAGPDARVRVGRSADGFYVADDGPGVDPTVREQVFDSGYTTADEGTGFGLTIVQRIVEEHDWDVSVSEGGRGGARFDVAVGEAPASDSGADSEREPATADE